MVTACNKLFCTCAHIPSTPLTLTFDRAASCSRCSYSATGSQNGSSRDARKREGKEASAHQLMWVRSHLESATWKGRGRRQATSGERYNAAATAQSRAQ